MVYGLSLGNCVTFLYYSAFRINKNSLLFQSFGKQVFRAIYYLGAIFFMLSVGNMVGLHEILNGQRQTTERNQESWEFLIFGGKFRKGNLCI